MGESANVFMARQPIFAGDQSVAAYELLFRSGETNSAGIIGSEQSARAIINSLIDIGLTQLVGESKAFINIDTDLLKSATLETLPQQRVVLEILETVEGTQENVDAVRRLHESGYTIALDDFTINPHSKQFLQFAKIIKFDVMNSSQNLVREVQRVKRPGITLLAEKVETKADFDICRRLGFELFQGYYFSKPEIVKGTSIPPNKLASLEIAAKLQNPDLDFDELEELIMADLALSHRLLRMVKSAHVGVPGKVASVKQALMFLGIKTVASIATLLAMSASSSKPHELVVTAFLRGKMCEQLAELHRNHKRDRFFTVGLLSVIDALLDAPMDQLLEQLPLDEEINRALLDPEFDSELAATLKTVLAYEAGDWDRLMASELDAKSVSEAYVEAVTWASDKGLALAAAPVAA